MLLTFALNFHDLEGFFSLDSLEWDSGIWTVIYLDLEYFSGFSYAFKLCIKTIRSTALILDELRAGWDPFNLVEFEFTTSARLFLFVTAAGKFEGI